MQILIHSSKTMRSDVRDHAPISKPALIEQATVLAEYLKSLDTASIEAVMKVSPKLAGSIYDILQSWTHKPSGISAVDSFVGDIYSGLQAGQWGVEDVAYAQDHLRILSGLYGILRPLDDILPYRLEMGYKLSNHTHKNMYEFWGDSIANHIPDKELLLNLTAIEYSKVLTKFIDASRFITPSFYTVHPKTGKQTFVAVHSKIARGAMANWAIRNRVSNHKDIIKFKDLGYVYDESQSTITTPTFICKEFKGLGLSVRITPAV